MNYKFDSTVGEGIARKKANMSFISLLVKCRKAVTAPAFYALGALLLGSAGCAMGDASLKMPSAPPAGMSELRKTVLASMQLLSLIHI